VFFIYKFILSFASQLPALDEKMETLQNASVETCVTYVIIQTAQSQVASRTMTTRDHIHKKGKQQHGMNETNSQPLGPWKQRDRMRFMSKRC